jgi:hypothetical protein
MQADFDYPVQYPRHEAALRAAHSVGGQAGTFGLSGGGSIAPALFGDDGLTFKDALDVVNPLQQLPIVGDIYRAVSGDGISTFSRLAGGALLGGPAGLLAAAAGSLFEAITGGGIATHALALLDEGSKAAPQGIYALKAYDSANKLG